MLLAGLFLALSFGDIAMGLGEDYAEDDRMMWWRPTFGDIDLENRDYPESIRHEVYETFGWGTWPSLVEVDYPRTPLQVGAYEHELQFFNNDPNFDNGWCRSTLDEPTVVAADLPASAYWDAVDANEYTWGMRSYQLQEDHVYDIRFKCESSWIEGGNHAFQQRAQIGHCHNTSVCNAATIWSDSTVTLIPSAVGEGPAQGGSTRHYDWYGTFDRNPSFESNLDNQWSVTGNGSTNWNCGGTTYHGQCFIRVKPDGPNSNPKLVFEYDPGAPQRLATASNYANWAWRCPSVSGNPDPGCQLGVKIIGYDAQDNVTKTYSFDGATLNQTLSWQHYKLMVASDAFPEGTAYWKFQLIGQTDGMTFDVDYHQLNYWRPA